MPSDPNELMNAARCVDSCIPEGMVAAVAIGIAQQQQERGILGEQGEFLGGEGAGEFILEE